MKINADIQKAAEQHVKQYMASHLGPQFTYHNLSHTKFVVDQAMLLSDAEGIGSRKQSMLGVAAWFHDLGYTVQAEDHEKHGASLAEEFLRKHNIDETDIEKVKAIILATKYPQEPTSKLERILCDADMVHLAENDFVLKSQQLRREWAITKRQSYTDAEWYQLNYQFITKHAFHTQFCKNEYQKGKLKNAERLELWMRSAGVSNFESVIKKPKRYKASQLVRGVETLFKNSSRNHMELSAMADNKAHILLSVSSLIVSILISFVLQQLTQKTHLIAPTVLLLSVCMTTIVFAILTTKPKISKGIFTVDQISNRNVNLLFFGNFHKMDLGTYEWGVNELIHDKEYLYGSMTKDIYYLGKVLAVKYKYLNLGYRVFMYGMIASVLAFSLSIFFS